MAKSVDPRQDPIVRQSDLDALGGFLQSLEARIMLLERALADALVTLDEIFGEEEADYDVVPAEEEDAVVEEEAEVSDDAAPEGRGTVPDTEELSREAALSEEAYLEAAEESGTTDPDEDEEVDIEALAREEAERNARKERNRMRRMERAAEGMDEEGPRPGILGVGGAPGESAMIGQDFRLPGNTDGIQIQEAQEAQGEEGWSGRGPA